ncbi:MAG TPA: response regulator transcription factor [Candidatus Onthomorpha intestinigallinarum]|uniref:Response regulator transcription factor n=1 Tax=Candidatus Onthomorpha intestinigallinarum TaxID=2840880 RepID=A0A9D1RFG1_9BACT|nr:response regulator transcription factor [Candidatus Onthomorpha intestinigallinarum]
MDKCTKDDRLYDAICDDYRLLNVISRFGMHLGFGEKTIEEVCCDRGIDCDTFLAVVNLTKSGSAPQWQQPRLSLRALGDYLQSSHTYFLNFLLPSIRRKLVEALGSLTNNDMAFLIIKFYDEFCLEVRTHMERENKEVFPYVDALMQGKKIRPVTIEISLMHRSPIEKKLSELKNIMIKYYDGNANDNLLNSILYDIFLFEEDLVCHCMVETQLFLGEIKRLEREHKDNDFVEVRKKEENTDLLSEREKDVIRCVVKGMTNKEVADKLFISINTVTTHRRNIARKLDIHSTSALTIYAIANKLLDMEEIKGE